MSIQSLLDYISVTPDIRQQGKVKHKLSAILFLTVCAVIAGADEWQEIEDFGHERLEWLVILIMAFRSMTPLHAL